MYEISDDAYRFIETNTAVFVQEVNMNKPVGTITPPKEANVRKSRFSFSSKQARDLGDSMMDHYVALAQKKAKTK